jgi:CheY-like chemotaxis protein
MNCEDEYPPIAATNTKTLAKYLDQILQLDRAILVAKAEKSLEAAAIANQAIAEIYLAWGKEKITAIYIQEAYDLYTQLGSVTNIENLELYYPQFLHPTLIQRDRIDRINYFTDEFIATLSHEFRNPLNGILGMSEALLEEVFGTMNERQLNAVTTIDRSGDYLLALINNMVDLSQIQAGKLELEMTDMPVAELCNFSTNFVRHHAIQKEIQLETNIPDNFGRIVVDVHRMRQVLINLLGRAIDTTPVGGKVRLVVTRTTSEIDTDNASLIQFSVIDTSKERSPATPDKCAKSTLSLHPKKIGLGLMLVNPIVALHGGTIGFHNIIGRGTAVNVCLPDIYFSDATTIHNDESENPGELGTFLGDAIQPPLILIVEDNELNINTISSYLTAKGYRPIVANEGKSAIELTQKHRPDLILMDIQMPGMDGFEAISRIRKQPELAAIPIIALTALAMEGDRERCIAAGANDYLTKPVKLKQLNATIQQLLK